MGDFFLSFLRSPRLPLFSALDWAAALVRPEIFDGVDTDYISSLAVSVLEGRQAILTQLLSNYGLSIYVSEIGRSRREAGSGRHGKV